MLLSTVPGEWLRAGVHSSLLIANSSVMLTRTVAAILGFREVAGLNTALL